MNIKKTDSMVGRLMKYEYGVEYETNGKKPDLPDDIVIECFDGVEWWGGYKYLGEKDLTPNRLTFKSSLTEKFRIVDDRFKPKEQNMNDWHKSGELPPVGEVVEYSCLYRDGKEAIELGQWYSGEIIAYHDGFVWTSDNGLRMISNTKFRPLKTEHDVLVEKASNDTKSAQDKYNVDISCSVAMRGVVDDLIDAGWRPIKQQSEAEFIKETHDYLLNSMARTAYRAGCRFVEQGA